MTFHSSKVLFDFEIQYWNGTSMADSAGRKCHRKQQGMEEVHLLRYHDGQDQGVRDGSTQ